MLTEYFANTFCCGGSKLRPRVHRSLDLAELNGDDFKRWDVFVPIAPEEDRYALLTSSESTKYKHPLLAVRLENITKRHAGPHRNEIVLWLKITRRSIFRFKHWATLGNN